MASKMYISMFHEAPPGCSIKERFGRVSAMAHTGGSDNESIQEYASNEIGWIDQKLAEAARETSENKANAILVVRRTPSFTVTSFDSSNSFGTHFAKGFTAFIFAEGEAVYIEGPGFTEPT